MIRPVLFVALAVALAGSPVLAQQVLPPGQIDASGNLKLGPVIIGKRQSGKFTITPDAVEGDASGSRVRGTRRPMLRSQADRASDTFQVRDYGAIGGGVSRTAQAVLGIATLADLAAWTADGTTMPYAFVSQYPFGKLFNLPVAAAAASGATSLTFSASRTSEAGSGLSGGYVYRVQDVAGLARGQTVAGNACAPAGTYVELVNPTTREVLTNVPTTCGSAAVSLTYRHPWLDRVTAGMQVSGPGVAAGTTVAAVSAGGVTLSTATTAALATRTLSSAATPVDHAAEITFYRPYTDAEARGLEMDGLGIQAAISAAYAAGGGRVDVPAGRYRLSHALIHLVEPQSPVIPYSRSVDLVGAGMGTTFLEPVADFGPGQAVLSCGDPTGTRDNDRGAYATSGSWCWGDWQELTARLPGTDFAFGRRPVYQGAPVLMDGLRRGARRQLANVAARGFVHGQTLVGDHMSATNAYFNRNWIGTRFASPTKSLYVDILSVQTFDYENAWAGVSVAPDASIGQGTWVKPYLGFQPYAIWFEPGYPAYDRAIDQTHIDTLNAEYVGCGVIVDGNVAGQASNAAARRGINFSKITRPVMLRNTDPGFLGGAGGSMPQGGCTWRAYVDVNDLSGTSIEDLSGPAVIAPPVAGAAGMIRTRSVSQFGATGEPAAGGFRLAGSGVATLLALYGQACAEIVASGAIGPNGDLDRISIEIPGGMKGRPVILSDTAATALPRGTLIEGVGGNFGYSLYGQRAGLASPGTAAPLGVAVQDFSGCAMSGKSVVVATQAPYVYARTSAAIGAGQVVKANPASPGMATAASSLTDGLVFGVSSGTTGQATSTNLRLSVGP